jgi:hypothetical protein
MLTTKINVQAKNTTKNTKKIRRRPTLQRLCPPISMGRAAVPPINDAADPYGPLQGAHGWVWRCDGWFACLGRQKETHRKTEIWTGPWFKVAANQCQ